MVWRTAASLAAVVAVVLTLASGAGAAVYWTNSGGFYQGSGSIGRANLDGTVVNESFITGATTPCGVAVDPNFIYWANSFEDAIGSANLDGTGVEQHFIYPTGGGPCGVAVDEHHIYWANKFDGNSIERTNLEGGEVSENFITGASEPSAVAANNAFIYWTNLGQNPQGAPNANNIGRANLDGTSPSQSFITGATAPNGVAVDGTHIYWANFGAHSIGRANLNGTSVEQSFITGASHPCGVAVDGAHIYWANSESGTIGRASLDGTSVEQSFITGASNPCGVAVDSVIVPTPPVITSPANGATYTQGQAVAASYSCRAPAGASVTRCTGPVANGAAIDTTTLGQQTFTVNATDSYGVSESESASYTVVAALPPPVIASPANGATYTQGQAVAASYSCRAPAGASVTRCTGPVANGAAIDTTTLGQHTFTVNAADSDGLSASQSASYTVVAAPLTAPALSSLSETAKTWREGNALAQISKKSNKKKLPLGTTFSFSLNVPASVTFTFTEPASGRKVGKTCVAQTKKNKKKPRCTRTVVAGTLTFSAHAGANKVRFEGRISKHKKLKPGNYTLLITATASGEHSTPSTLYFTIANG
jgi:virginiamycin B lyase